jgi:hypothetical protein
MVKSITITNQNCIYEEIKSRLNSEKTCYHSVRSHLNKTIILPVVLYGCETWSLTLTEEQILRVFENRVLGRISRPTRDEVMGGWRRLYNEELHNLHASSNITRAIKSRRMKWVRHVAHMGEIKNAYRIWLENLK